jgi:hypothetical protein
MSTFTGAKKASSVILSLTCSWAKHRCPLIRFSVAGIAGPSSPSCRGRPKSSSMHCAVGVIPTETLGALRTSTIYSMNHRVFLLLLVCFKN